MLIYLRSIVLKRSKDMSLQPFVKWAGGKRQIMDKLLEFKPKKYKHYYEPFVGGGAIGEEVHHKILLTPSNIFDTNVTLNKENLIYLCKECHNKEHERFKKSKPMFDSCGNLIPF